MHFMRLHMNVIGLYIVIFILCHFTAFSIISWSGQDVLTPSGLSCMSMSISTELQSGQTCCRQPTAKPYKLKYNWSQIKAQRYAHKMMYRLRQWETHFCYSRDLYHADFTAFIEMSLATRRSWEMSISEWNLNHSMQRIFLNGLFGRPARCLLLARADASSTRGPPRTTHVERDTKSVCSQGARVAYKRYYVIICALRNNYLVSNDNEGLHFVLYVSRVCLYIMH